MQTMFDGELQNDALQNDAPQEPDTTVGADIDRTSTRTRTVIASTSSSTNSRSTVSAVTLQRMRIDAQEMHCNPAPTFRRSLSRTASATVAGTLEVVDRTLTQLLSEMTECEKKLTELRKAVKLFTSNQQQLMRTMPAELSAPRRTLVLPIRTFEEFMTVESEMSDPGVTGAMSDEIRFTPGATMKQFVYALLQRVLAKRLCLQFTYSGFRNGFVFKHSSLCLFIIEQVLQRPRFSHESRQSVVNIIKNWFHLNRDKRRQLARTIRKESRAKTA